MKNVDTFIIFSCFHNNAYHMEHQNMLSYHTRSAVFGYGCKQCFYQ